MSKELFKEFLTNAIDEKKNLLLQNSISDEDKEMIQTAITNLESMLTKVDELEDEAVANEAIEELKTTVTDLSDKLTALNERINQSKENNEENEDNKMNYLETKNAIHDFAEVIRNSRNAEEFRANWKDVLMKNDAYSDTVTVDGGSAEAFMPAAVKGMIQDIWDKNSGFLKDLNYTNAKRFYCRANNSAQGDETSRAKGHKKGDTKASQKIELAAKLLEGQYIYKIAELSYQTIWDSDEDLIKYVVNELVDQMLYEVKRAILVGDGRANDSDYKINKIEAIYKTSGDSYTSVFTVGDANTGFLVDDIRLAVDSIHNPNNKDVYAFMNKATLRTLARVQASSTSTPVFMSREQVAEQIGATKVIDTDLLSDNEVIAMIPSEYYMVGANILNPEWYSWHDGLKNIDYYRYESVVGGGINGLKSTAVLKAE